MLKPDLTFFFSPKKSQMKIRNVESEHKCNNICDKLLTFLLKHQIFLFIIITICGILCKNKLRKTTSVKRLHWIDQKGLKTEWYFPICCWWVDDTAGRLLNLIWIIQMIYDMWNCLIESVYQDYIFPDLNTVKYFMFRQLFYKPKLWW